jgi:hypothetical protein
MVYSAAMGRIPLSGIVMRDSIILVGFFEPAIRHERPLIDAILETGVARKDRTLLMAELTMRTCPRLTFSARFSGLEWSHIFVRTSHESFTPFGAPVSFWLPKAEKYQNNIDKPTRPADTKPRQDW